MTHIDDITLIPASIEDHPLVQNMARFYVYDMSLYMGWEMPEDGLYECIDFKHYFEEKNSFPFLIRVSNELAGFVIINKTGSTSDVEWNMSQFFVIRKFQNKGIAKNAAFQCFKKFPGTWEVMVMLGNEGAYLFWRKIIKEYTHNHFEEATKPVAYLNNETRNLFKFSSKIK
jgi:ribosomal-protein-alanine N-acetyltransferase